MRPGLFGGSLAVGSTADFTAIGFIVNVREAL
jgi:hypothetical protein